MSYSTIAWALVLLGLVVMTGLTTIGLYRGIAASGTRRTAILIAGGFAVIWALWVVISATLADRGAYEQSPVAARPWIGLAVGGSLIALLVGAAIPAVRTAFSTPRSLAAITVPQVARVVGVVFLLAMLTARLPAVFALPAGLGDIAVGVAAIPIARRLARGDRSGAVWFNILGLTDLIVAVSLGFLAGLGPTQLLSVSPSTADVALLPLALIPTTAVPLAMALHIRSMATLRHTSHARVRRAAAVAP